MNLWVLRHVYLYTYLFFFNLKVNGFKKVETKLYKNLYIVCDSVNKYLNVYLKIIHRFILEVSILLLIKNTSANNKVFIIMNMMVIDSILLLRDADVTLGHSRSIG